MKLKNALVFSSDVDAMPALLNGANALAEESLAVVLGCEKCAGSVKPYAAKIAWLGKKADGSMAEDYTGAVEAVIRKEEAPLVLMSTGTRDRCIAAKLAVRLNAAVITDAASVSVEEDGSVAASRNVYGGTAEASLRSTAKVTIVLTSGGIFEACPPAREAVVEEIPAEPDDDGVTLVATEPAQEEAVNITAAKRIVSAGLGIGSQENLAVLEQLASKIGAETGCTRPIAEEAHWMARGRYIGVSGVTVRPDVYIACGVSGQVQHMVGVNDAKVIVAINKDARAPIFQNCDIGLVADLNKVLPALTELL